MGVKLVSASAGSVEIVPPTTASNYTATLPAGTGSIVVNGVNGSIVSGTAVNSTSGTSIDFTGIPSWVKRITVMFQGVSTNGTSNYLIQIGAGSVTTSGYLGASSTTATSSSTTNFTTGFGIYNNNGATNVFHGFMVLTLLGSNNWVGNGAFALSSHANTIISGGSIALGGTLDRVRITTAGGTDTFDAGSINILYE